MLEPGTKVGRYIIEEAIGSGAMAYVYRAHVQYRERRVAIKYLAVPNHRQRRRMMREALVQSTLTHRNIVTFIERIEVDGDPALVMEWVDGIPLDRWLRAHEPEPGDARNIVAQLARALGYCHSRGVIHRDVKPSNILMARHDHGWLPKLADFGIARIEAWEDESALTLPQTSLGSPGYIPPEQDESAHDVDPRADIFALGAVLFELLTGEPFRRPGEEPSEVSPQDLRMRLSGTPPELAAVVERCMKADPEDRYPTCGDLLVAMGEPHELDGDDEPEPAYSIPTVMLAERAGTHESTRSFGGSESEMLGTFALRVFSIWTVLLLLVVSLLTALLWGTGLTSSEPEYVPLEEILQR